MLLDPGDEPKEGRFAWVKRISARQRVLLALGIVLIGLAVVGHLRPEKVKKETTSQQTPPQNQQRVDPRGQQAPNDDLDSAAAGSPAPSYPDRTAGAADVKSEKNQDKAAGQSYNRDTPRPPRADGSVPTAQPGGAGASLEPVSGRSELAGAPSGAVAPPPKGDRARLREVLGAEWESSPQQTAQPAAGSAAAAAQRSTQQTIATPSAVATANGSSNTPAEFAPYGRLLKCRLVFTVDSINTGAPIVAMVMEDLWWNGVLIIPANTEIFSRVGGTRRDGNKLGRILDSNEWIMVLPEQDGRTNGRELAIRAQALDRQEMVVDASGRPRSWGIGDGGVGLTGDTIRTTDNEELKLFASAALSGLASGAGQTMQTREPVGNTGSTQPEATPRNAAINAVSQGTTNLLNTYAQRIAEDIAQNGSYVRVPGGKEFYLFIDQSLDPLAAKVGLKMPTAADASPLNR
ncbi:TrbI/VirB10 family protein [Oleiharenicola sp. Vm1]|uniref:TrbI/VirB10 family protein n=1 Tax=Oleiharenicola sp. Vm1 TaxID=3398393 RepID=UPI0039F44C85